MKKIVIWLAGFLLGTWLFGQEGTGLSLAGEWKLSYGPYGQSAPGTPAELRAKGWPEIPAAVPGNVELDLLTSGKISDPEIGNHIYALRQFEGYQWWYSRSFATPALAIGDRLEIVFEGLDCFGTIWINGRLVGKTDNMLIAHRFDITDLLTPAGGNTVHVRIDPATAEAQKYINGSIGSRKFFRVEQEHVRKAPHMYGWDIMPRLV